MNVWYILAGCLALSLVVYAHHESSRAAYYRAKARELQLRTEERNEKELEAMSTSNSLVVELEEEHNTFNNKPNHFDKQLVDDRDEKKSEALSTTSNSLSEELAGENSYDSSPGHDKRKWERMSNRDLLFRLLNKDVEDIASPQPTNWRAKWDRLPDEFLEEQADNIVEQYEMEFSQDYEDYSNSKEPRNQAHVPLFVSKERELRVVELDTDAIDFLDAVTRVNHDTKPAEWDRSIFTEDTSNLIQSELPLNVVELPVSTESYPAINLAGIGSTPRHGVHYMSGVIVEVFDEEMCRIEDETGSRIINHKRLGRFNMHDQVLCQFIITSGGWQCAQVWQLSEQEITHHLAV